LAVDISANSPDAFGNLISSFGNLETIAGNGFGGVDGFNYWQPSFEGGPAINATLSRPHFAMADNAGNVFIVDKDSHSVLKITTDGTLHTVIGTHTPGDTGGSPTPGTSVQLNTPNGLWVRGDGTVYVLDTGNGKVRRMDPSGIVTTLFKDNGGIIGGRGLWVNEAEDRAYYCDGPNVKKWRPSSGINAINNKNFVDLGNLVVDSAGSVVVTDRGANRVYRINGDGTRDPIAGTGGTNAVVDGTAVLDNGLYGVRGIWYLPNGGYLLALHEGSQILYVDPAGVVHIFVDGAPGNAHSGDGAWFHTPGLKISEARSVSMDSRGNILIVENDSGYVRRIVFRRLTP
jgi:sugar lactone lactonase YvrE